MAATLRYDDDYIVGGSPRAQVSPNFNLSEYQVDGETRTHRDLTTAVQLLRDDLGAPIRITGRQPRDGFGKDKHGLFVWLAADDAEGLQRLADQLVAEGDLAQVGRVGDDIYVEVAESDRAPGIKAERAFGRAVQITAGFETSGDPFLQVTGNFDGAGISFGPLQVNFKSGTLQEVFRRFHNADERTLARCFGNDYPEWQRILKSSRQEQIAWADSVSTGSRKQNVQQPWRGYLQAVGQVPRFRRELLGYAYDVYGRKLIVAVSWLEGLSNIRITNFRCLCSLYDLCVQQGSLDKAHDAIRKRVAKEQPKDQFELIRIAVEERGRKASKQWRADCISRRLSILQRQPVPWEEEGVKAERRNPNLYLVRHVDVKDVNKYLV
jgi:hypothetical protein